MEGFYASSPETWKDVENWEKVDNLSETSSSTSSDSSSDVLIVQIRTLMMIMVVDIMMKMMNK